MMASEEPYLPFIPVARQCGLELFHRSSAATENSLLGFWQWSASDLIGNTARGVLAEYIVALDLGIANGARSGWDPFDLRTGDGIAVEVKSGAYIQTWEQKKYSELRFGIAPTLRLDPKTDQFSDTQDRWSEVYVFCVLACRQTLAIDPLDLDQWEFYVLSTATLNERVPAQKTIGLSSLLSLGAQETRFGAIEATIGSVLS